MRLYQYCLMAAAIATCIPLMLMLSRMTTVVFSDDTGPRRRSRYIARAMHLMSAFQILVALIVFSGDAMWPIANLGMAVALSLYGLSIRPPTVLTRLLWRIPVVGVLLRLGWYTQSQSLVRQPH